MGQTEVWTDGQTDRQTDRQTDTLTLMVPDYTIVENPFQVKKIFVGGLRDADLCTDDLEDYFGKYGRVKEAIIMQKDGQSRGFAFVSFDDYDPVDKLLCKSSKTSLLGVCEILNGNFVKRIVCLSVTGLLDVKSN